MIETSNSMFRLLMANEQIAHIVRKACAGDPHAAETIRVIPQRDVGAFREGYTIYCGGKAIVSAEVWQGAFGEVKDLLAQDEKALEDRLTKKLIGCGLGINRFPGMCQVE